MSFSIKKTTLFYLLLALPPLVASSLPEKNEKRTFQKHSSAQTGIQKIQYGIGLTVLGCLSLLIRSVPDNYSPCSILSNPSTLELCHRLRNSQNLSDIPLETLCILTGTVIALDGVHQLFPRTPQYPPTPTMKHL